MTGEDIHCELRKFTLAGNGDVLLVLVERFVASDREDAAKKLERLAERLRGARATLAGDP